MKTLFLLSLLAGLLGALGCTTPGGDKYRADQPPPVASSAKKVPAPVPDAPPAVPAMPEMKKRVSADQIDDGNVEDQIRLLENQMQTERRAMTKAGR